MRRRGTPSALKATLKTHTPPSMTSKKCDFFMPKKTFLDG